jgi:uncharacterized damage-inducible protein DinB
MLGREDLRRLLEYTTWANHRAVRSAAVLTPADFKRDLGGSRGGLRGTFTHMLNAEWLWLERWKGAPPPREIDEGQFADVLSLRERWRAIEAHRSAWLDALDPSAPGALVTYAADQARHTAPLWQLVQHCANHSTYHRGEVANLLRLLGARVAPTDMVLWDRSREE